MREEPRGRLHEAVGVDGHFEPPSVVGRESQAKITDKVGTRVFCLRRFWMNGLDWRAVLVGAPIQTVFAPNASNVAPNASNAPSISHYWKKQSLLSVAPIALQIHLPICPFGWPRD